MDTGFLARACLEARVRLRYLWSVESEGKVDSKTEIWLLLPLGIILAKEQTAKYPSIDHGIRVQEGTLQSGEMGCFSEEQRHNHGKLSLCL